MTLAAPAPSRARRASRPVPIGVWIFGGAVGRRARHVGGLRDRRAREEERPRQVQAALLAGRRRCDVVELHVRRRRARRRGDGGRRRRIPLPHAAFGRGERGAGSASARARTAPFAAPLPGGGAVGRQRALLEPRIVTIRESRNRTIAKQETAQFVAVVLDRPLRAGSPCAMSAASRAEP